MSKTYEYTVVSSQMMTPSTLQIKLHIDVRRPMAYEPGQYVAISFIHNGRPTPTRCFTIVSSPTDQHHLELAVKVGGDYTHTAAGTLVPGSKVIVEGPFGNFVYDTERDRSAVLIAGGIGITPFISMIRYASKLQLASDIGLIYSLHSQEDIPFLSEIKEVIKSNPRLRVIFAVSSGPTDKLSGLNVTNGHVDAKLLDRVLSSQYLARTYFICGPKTMMDSLYKTIHSKGVSEDYIITEDFTQGQPGHKALKYNLPLQVYALSGLSILLGTATILVKDTVTPIQYEVANGSISSASVHANSRDKTVKQTISKLESGSSDAPASSSPSAPTITPAPQSKTVTATTPSVTIAPTPPSSGNGTTVGGGTTTPPPAPIAPKVSISSITDTITSGQSTTLTWSINPNATAPVACNASGGWSGGLPSSGSKSVSPTTTTTYTISCSNSAGTSSGSVTITVAPACVSTPSKPC